MCYEMCGGSWGGPIYALWGITGILVQLAVAAVIVWAVVSAVRYSRDKKI